MRERRLTNLLDRAAAATAMVAMAAATCLAALALGDWAEPDVPTLVALGILAMVSVSLSPITFLNEEVSVDIRELVVAATVVPLGGVTWAVALGLGASASRIPYLVRAVREPDARLALEGWKTIHAGSASIVAASAAIAVGQAHLVDGPVWRTIAVVLLAALVHGLTSSLLVNATAAFVTHKRLPIFTRSALAGLVVTAAAGTVGAILWAAAAPAAPPLLPLALIVLLVNTLGTALRRRTLDREEVDLREEATSLILVDPSRPRHQLHEVVEELTRAALDCLDATVTRIEATGPGEITAPLGVDGLHLVAARPVGTRMFTKRDRRLLARLAESAGEALAGSMPTTPDHIVDLREAADDDATLRLDD